MRKKELFTAILCITLTTFIIGIVMKSGNKPHPDILYQTETEKSEMGEARTSVKLHPYRVYMEREKELVTMEQGSEDIETLELGDVVEEVEMAEELAEEDVGDPVQETEREQTEHSTPPPAQVNQRGPADRTSDHGSEKPDDGGDKSASEDQSTSSEDHDDENEEDMADDESTEGSEEPKEDTDDDEDRDSEIDKDSSSEKDDDDEKEPSDE